MYFKSYVGSTCENIDGSIAHPTCASIICDTNALFWNYFLYAYIFALCYPFLSCFLCTSLKVPNGILPIAQALYGMYLCVCVCVCVIITYKDIGNRL